MRHPKTALVISELHREDRVTPVGDRPALTPGTSEPEAARTLRTHTHAHSQ